MHPPAAARLARRQPVFPLAALRRKICFVECQRYSFFLFDHGSRTIDRRAANHSPGRRWPSRCTRGTSPSTDRALGMRPRSGHYPTGVQRRAARYHQARSCHVMTTCFSQSQLVFAAKLAMSRGARYGKRGGANQNRNRVQRKNRMCKFKNQFGKMLSCNFYFHNSIPSSGQRA